MTNKIRLNKFLTEAAYCSRREADDLIRQGKVLVNGKVATVGSVVIDSDQVFVGNKRINNDKEKVYIALNKPSGITCTTDKNDPSNIVDFVGFHERIYPIGRLDKDSEGLILLTNDGDIVNRILRAGNSHEKEYLVRVNKPINKKFQSKMMQGVKVHNTVTLPCTVRLITPMIFTITLVQGLNRQIRLMCEALGYEVVNLKRTRIMHIDLKGIGVGNYRKLSASEIEMLLEATKNSLKTGSVSKGAQPKQSKNNPSVRYAKKLQSRNKKSNTFNHSHDSSKDKNGLKGSKKLNKKKSPIRNKMKKKK